MNSHLVFFIHGKQRKREGDNVSLFLLVMI